MGRAFCDICKQTVKYRLSVANFTTTVNGKEYYYIGQEAHCFECGALVDVPEINEYNMSKFKEACKKRNEYDYKKQNEMRYPIVVQTQNAYKQYAKLLAKNNVTSYRVAKETGIVQTTLSNWKNGKSTPNFETLWKIANYFCVPIDYFTKNDIGELSDEDEIAFEKLKKSLRQNDFNEDDVDFLITVFEAHKKDDT